MTPEEEVLYTRCRALAMLDEAMSKTVLEEARAAIRAAVEQQRQKDAEIARSFAEYNVRRAARDIKKDQSIYDAIADAIEAQK